MADLEPTSLNYGRSCVHNAFGIGEDCVMAGGLLTTFVGCIKARRRGWGTGHGRIRILHLVLGYWVASL